MHWKIWLTGLVPWKIGIVVIVTVLSIAVAFVLLTIYIGRHDPPGYD